ncbi:neutral and basic amino acid transport protein rBAT-like isoform X2 [Teleopsis dalmanni]|uniref:neutral and basic amino acid transport protein rBAT-like isoform X2 n=1 Tax=Teleopsis dalmanni TaxID=139649 RepID=UPI0018CED9F4|nr:neutral and basic amino acid transport protein rBAT-like isoform X2 [Teleopsis dalmanni]
MDTNGHGPNGNITLSKDAPSFVSWNWPLIRKCTFFAFMSSLLAMCAVVVAMIITLPKTCNPKTAWYRGSVFYEIFPASFQDSNSDGYGDIRGIENRIEYLASMGVAAVRLNSIFPTSHYPDDYKNTTSLTKVAHVLGDVHDVAQLAKSLHERNMSLILDLPINVLVKDLGKVSSTTSTTEQSTENNNTKMGTTTTAAANTVILSENMITEAIRKWLNIGINGFYIKGLEYFTEDTNLLHHLAEWKRLLGPECVLIVSEAFLNNLSDDTKATALQHIDLVDVHLEVTNGTKHMDERIKSVLEGAVIPHDNGAWIHWSISGEDRDRITTAADRHELILAATLMQLMLPGTPNIFYGDEIALDAVSDPHNEHSDTKHLHHLPTMQYHNTTQQFTSREILPWLPKSASLKFEHFEIISQMIKLRDRSPSIYKNAICKPETTLPNTQIRRSHDDILVVERVYPRRNSFVSVSNFGKKRVTMDMTSMYYSGVVMLQKSQKDKIYFSDFEIGPLETIVVKLDK